MWQLGIVQIFPQSLDDDYDQSIARLSPLASGTIYHTFGYDNDIKKVNAYVIGAIDKLTLIGYNRDAALHSLYNDTYWWGDYYVKHLSFKMEPSIYQTLRPDLVCNSIVYIADFELFKAE